MSSVAIRTVGCRLNQAESAQIASSFKRAGFSIKSFADHCDVYIVHSCTITKKAERKSVLYATSIKKSHPDATVILAGCAVAADTENRLKNKEIDILVDQQDKLRIPELLGTATQTDHKRLSEKEQLYQADTSVPYFETTRALIKVQDGCNFNCAYCIVPKARGNPYSVPFAQIMQEVKSIAEQGYREVILTGANLGRYISKGNSLISLLQSIEKISGIDRIRLSSIELSTIERNIIDYMADSEKLCHYLHLPLQSGDDDILQKMGRKYTTSQYSAIVEYAASKMKLPGLGTDIITGFPGETASQHANTVRLIKSLPLNNYHVFPYSVRPDTRAASLPDQLDTQTKKDRCAELIEIGTHKRHDFAKQYISRNTSVLIERVNKKCTAKGWTGEYLEAEFHSEGLKPNDIVQFAPSAVSNHVLRGKA